ncbi:MAG TPA: hypothetical protein VID72_01515 [Ktedonobacterales bacterium]
MTTSSSASGRATGSVASTNDLFTIGAMAIVAYLISAFTHEALGHGLASLIVNAPIKHVTSLDLVSDLSHLTPWGARFVDAAGCAAQFIVAGVVYVIYRHTPSASGNWRYFLWLLYLINVLIPAGYLLVLSFASFGDWNDFVQGLRPELFWRVVLTIIGASITLAAIFIGARQLDEFLGQDVNERFGRAMQLVLTSYLVGSTANTLAGIFNPDGAILVLISAAAATFGGTICLFWTGFVAGRLPPRADTPILPRVVTRQAGWLIAGAVALVIYFAVLGPGIPR